MVKKVLLRKYFSISRRNNPTVTGFFTAVRYDILNKDAVAEGSRITVREQRNHRRFIRTKRPRWSYTCQKVRRQAREKLILGFVI